MFFVGDGPLDFLSFGEVHGLRDGGGKIDVPLLAVFAVDELDFSWESPIPVSIHITRYDRKKNLSPCRREFKMRLVVGTK